MMPQVQVVVEEIAEAMMKEQAEDLEGVQPLLWKNWDLMLAVLQAGKLLYGT
jgi:hypothetical protein